MPDLKYAPSLLYRLYMQGIKRKIVYVTAFEIIGMAISTAWLTLLSGESPTSTGPLAIMITTI
ncbi:MAG: chlorhexidine efflux transporter, partial [Janthinobacterium sp.]